MELSNQYAQASERLTNEFNKLEDVIEQIFNSEFRSLAVSPLREEDICLYGSALTQLIQAKVSWACTQQLFNQRLPHSVEPEINNLTPVAEKVNLGDNYQNGYERIGGFLKNEPRLKSFMCQAEVECRESNCQSEPILFITAIEKLLEAYESVCDEVTSLEHQLKESEGMK